MSTNQSIPAEQSLFEQIQATHEGGRLRGRPHPLDLSSWYGALGTNDYNLVSAPYTKVGPDVLRILYHSDGTVPAPSGYFANHAQVKRPRARRPARPRRASPRMRAERADLYKQAQKIVLEGFYVLPLYDQQNHYLLGSTVAGFRALPSVSTPMLYDTWLR